MLERLDLSRGNTYLRKLLVLARGAALPSPRFRQRDQAGSLGQTQVTQADQLEGVRSSFRARWGGPRSADFHPVCP